MSALTHITVNSGHVRQSPRSEVEDHIVEMLIPLLRRALQGERVDVPGAESHTMSGGVDEDCCAVTLWAELRQHGPAPLLTTYIAAADGPAADRLWSRLRSDLPQPTAPWLADELRAPAMIDLAALAWTGDWTRCVAWAWLQIVEERNAA